MVGTQEEEVNILEVLVGTESVKSNPWTKLINYLRKPLKSLP